MNKQVGHISVIVALGKKTRSIGKDGDLIWKGLKEDLARFKEKTAGHPVIMGRHTWLSLPEKYRPLPGRTNIVMSGAKWFTVPPEVGVASTLEHALTLARSAPGADEIFIIGGGRVYADALALADTLYVTEIDSDEEGDTFFPDYSEFTEVVEEEAHPEHSPPFVFRTLKRSRT